MAAAARLTYEEAHHAIHWPEVRLREEAAEHNPEYVRLFETEFSREQQLKAVAYLRGAQMATSRCFWMAHARLPRGGGSDLQEDMALDVALAAPRALVALYTDGEL